MRWLKCFATLACVGIVASAYAACYTWGYGIVIPQGTTTSYTTTMVCDSSNGQTYSSSYWWGFQAEDSGTVGDYRLTPPGSGYYYYAGTGTLQYWWSYTDCYNQHHSREVPKNHSYPSVDFVTGPTCLNP